MRRTWGGKFALFPGEIGSTCVTKTSTFFTARQDICHLESTRVIVLPRGKPRTMVSLPNCPPAPSPWVPSANQSRTQSKSPLVRPFLDKEVWNNEGLALRWAKSPMTNRTCSVNALNSRRPFRSPTWNECYTNERQSHNSNRGKTSAGSMRTHFFCVFSGRYDRQ